MFRRSYQKDICGELSPRLESISRYFWSCSFGIVSTMVSEFRTENPRKDWSSWRNGLLWGVDAVIETSEHKFRTKIDNVNYRKETIWSPTSFPERMRSLHDVKLRGEKQSVRISKTSLMKRWNPSSSDLWEDRWARFWRSVAQDVRTIHPKLVSAMETGVQSCLKHEKLMDDI